MIYFFNKTISVFFIKNLHFHKKIKDIAPNIDSSQARYELYIVRTQFESLAQGMDELGPKKPNTMNL